MRGVGPITFVVALVAALGGCNDLRDFRGPWAGPRVGDAAPLRVGVADTARASLVVESLDLNGLRGTLAVDGLVTAAPLVSIEGAEADVLSGMTFEGSPLRVYLAFVPIDDGMGDALVVASMHDDDRVELRLMRSGGAPLYGIFALERQ